jgi:N-acetylneuraminate synthase
MSRTFIIAEAGVNHNGSVEIALQLIDVAAKAGVDAVKFQTFKSEAVVSRHALKAEYQVKNSGKESDQLSMIRKLELSDDDHHLLVGHCKKLNIEFMSTPFDLKSLDFLVDKIGVSRLKIPSGEITNAPLLLAAARSGRPLIVSTGMCTLEDIRAALGVFAYGFTSPALTDHRPKLSDFEKAYRSTEGQKALKEKITLLHCTSEYPAPFADVNLRAMDLMRDEFNLPVGYSDHTKGIAVPVAAVALGATVIEKHFTLDRAMPGPDHIASIEPSELSQMSAEIRQIESALGKRGKVPAPSEIKNMPIARKSLVASRTIRKGEVFTEENLTTKRPGSGISPMHYWEWIGRTADRDYDEDELLQG